MCVKAVFVALCEVYHLFLVYVSDLTSELCVLCVCVCRIGRRRVMSADCNLFEQ